MRRCESASPMRSRWCSSASTSSSQDGVTLTRLPLSERKKDLRRLCSKSRIRYLKWVECFPDGEILLRHCEQRLDRPYVSGPSSGWQKTKCAAWRAENQFRHKLFEGLKKRPVSPRTERERALQMKREEVAHVLERLADPDVDPGMAREVRKHVASLERG